MFVTDFTAGLGKPYFQAPNYVIYNADCLSLLSKLPENCLDLTVTSPPYNIGKEYESTLPLESYLEWCEKWIGELYRVTKTNTFANLENAGDFAEKGQNCHKNSGYKRPLSVKFCSK